jgi:hypothetical protein
LKIQGEVEGRDRDAGTSLPWVDEGFLDNADIIDICTGNDEIFISIGNVILAYSSAGLKIVRSERWEAARCILLTHILGNDGAVRVWVTCK